MYQETMSLNQGVQNKLTKVFEVVDANGDKTITWDEIKEISNKLGISVTHADYKAFCKSDINNDRKLDFEEFCKFTESRLKKVFDEIDKDKNGKLDEYEIQKVLEKLNMHICLREIQSILHGMDKDGDKEIDFDEFCDFFADLPTLDLRAVAHRWLCGVGIDVGVDQLAYALPPAEMPIYRFMLAGGISVAVSRTAVAPLEKIKILSQVSKTENLKVGATLRRVFSAEGARGLYAGNLTNCLRLLPNGAIVGLVYSNMIKYTPVDNIKNPFQPEWRFLSGAAAGLASNTATYPMDVIRTKLTVQDFMATKHTKKYTGIYNTAKRIVAEEGFRGLYKGLTPALISIVPFVGIQQSLYDVLKLHTNDSEFEKLPITFLACGTVAGTTAQTVVHPLEVVRRCMQLDESVPKSKSFKEEYAKKLFREEIRSLWKQGGLKRFYAGWTAACLKIVPSATISLLIRDALLDRLNKD